MKKLLGIIVVVLILAVAGFVGAAYWSGRQAERWYQDALAQGTNNPDIKLSTASYQRGLFSSQIASRVQFTLLEMFERRRELRQPGRLGLKLGA